MQGSLANPWHTAAPRPCASDRCKPGHQGFLPQGDPKGDGVQRGRAQRVKCRRLDDVAELRRAVFPLSASPYGHH